MDGVLAMAAIEMPNPLAGGSRAIREIRQDLECATQSSANVLITGEAGVGKTSVAKQIHRDGARPRGPLVWCDCSLPDEILEHELFDGSRSHRTGVRTDQRSLLERARGGTMFLNRLSGMSLRVQTRLNRFLERAATVNDDGTRGSGPTRGIRFIAASDRTLLARLIDNTFSDELFYRLNVFHLTLPALRDRREDIPLLFDQCLRWYSDQHCVPPPDVKAAAATVRLAGYDWPGNLRELKKVTENLVEQAPIRPRPENPA